MINAYAPACHFQRSTLLSWQAVQCSLQFGLRNLQRRYAIGISTIEASRQFQQCCVATYAYVGNDFGDRLLHTRVERSLECQQSFEVGQKSL